MAKTKDTIKDFHGRIIGYIETDDNGDKVVRDFYNRIVGYYQKSDNTTRDFYRRIVTKGDAAAMLLADKK